MNPRMPSNVNPYPFPAQTVVDPPVRRRGGILGAWLNMTAPRRPAGILSLAQREQLRKAELTSYSILVVAAFLVTLFANTIADPGTASAVVLMAIFLTITALLNRFGATRFAAYVTPSALMLLIMLAVLSSPGGLRLIAFPAYDLFVLPIFIISLTGNRWAVWVFALIGISFIVGDVFLQPHALVTATGVSLTRSDGFDEVAREIRIFSFWGLINRDVALSLFAAFFGFLGATSVQTAIARADRAEEVAELEGRELENKRQIEAGAQHLLEVHTRVANGDFTARAGLDRGNVLWSVGQSLNNLLQRLQRQGQAEFQLRRTEEEAQRLMVAIQEVKANRYPIWPQAAQTIIDGLTAQVVELVQILGLGRQVTGRSQQGRLPNGPNPGQGRPALPDSYSGQGISSFPPGGSAGLSTPAGGPLPGTFGYEQPVAHQPQYGQAPAQYSGDPWPSLQQPPNPSPSFPPNAAPPWQPPNQAPEQYGDATRQQRGYADNPWFITPDENPGG